ncbi:MAG: hypothetical protein QM817_10230 [Archangium sp.]
MSDDDAACEDLFEARAAVRSALTKTERTFEQEEKYDWQSDMTLLRVVIERLTKRAYERRKRLAKKGAAS